MLRSMMIKTRLRLALGVLALLLAGTGFYGLKDMSNIRQNAEVIEVKLVPSLQAISTMEVSLSKMRTRLLRVALYKNVQRMDEHLTEVKKLNAELNEAQRQYKNYVDENDDVRVNTAYQQYANLDSTYTIEQDRAIMLMRSERFDEAMQILEQITPKADQMSALLKELHKISIEEIDRARQSSIETYNSSQWAVGLLISVSVLIAGIISAALSRSINAPLHLAVETAEYIAEGDLRHDIVSSGHDELTELTHSLIKMQSNLRDALGHISSSSSQLASAAEELNVVTESSSRNLMQQHDEVQQAATAITEMSSAVDEVAGTALRTSDAATAASALTQEGTSKVQQTRTVIEKMYTDVHHSTEVINTLSNKVSSINTVLDVIRKVADQTNLLALNAAIEAARAGDAGRGFSVVADEVRNLAARTQTLTGEIEQMIQEVSGSAGDAVASMKVISDRADNAKTSSQTATDALESIAANIMAISDQSHVVASAAEQQSKVAREIDRNIIAINDLSTQTAAGSEQTSASSSELSKLALTLNELVGRFKLA